jgi:hypothetical protein
MQGRPLSEHLIVRQCRSRSILLESQTMPPNHVKSAVLVHVLDHFLDGPTVSHDQRVAVHVDFGWESLVTDALLSE